MVMHALRALATHARVLLMLTQVLPQFPIKPLSWLTPQPRHERIRFTTGEGAVVGDLFQPGHRRSRAGRTPRPALVLAFGMTLHEHDRPILLDLGRTLARLGFVCLWPRLETVDAGAPLPEVPTTFSGAATYLASRDDVDPQRISSLGFSVGASTALVAAAQVPAPDSVRAVIFFGGYFDLLEYLVSAGSGTVLAGGQVIPWKPTGEVRRRMEPILQATALPSLLGLFHTAGRPAAQRIVDDAPPAEVAGLRALSPAEHLQRVRARVFILHDRGDAFVPYVESLKLRAALPPAQLGAFLLTDLFAHAQPKSGLSLQVARDVIRLYRFVYAVLAYC